MLKCNKLYSSYIFENLNSIYKKIKRNNYCLFLVLHLSIGIDRIHKLKICLEQKRKQSF